jgi:heat shock protein HslJ
MANPLAWALAAALLATAAPALAQPVTPFVGAHGATTPATYRGDHAGEAWHLDLWPDQAFHLVRRPGTGGAPTSHAGRWHAAGGALILDFEGEQVALAVRNAERLRPAGAPEDASGDLVTDGALDVGTITLRAAGMLTYLADAATFLHCATGHRYPVALEGDWLAAERSYLADRPGPGEPLFVTLEATLEPREPMEGPVRPMVVVDSFGASWPGEDCASAATAPGLEGTVWRIRAIGGEELDWAPPRREPFLLLHPGEARFNASVGCNTMRGGFQAEGEDLSFTATASTMMACPHDLAEAEAALTEALGATAAWAIGGRTLRLLDGAGGVTATLEGVYLP